MTTHVLILCTHNSARSVLSEGMLNHWAAKLGLAVQAHSAGSAPSGRINPYAIEALQGAGIETSTYRVFFGAKGEAGAQPVKVHWGYPDPSNVSADADGGFEGKRRAFELTRQAIGYRMLQLLALPLARLDRPALQAALVAIGRS